MSTQAILSEVQLFSLLDDQERATLAELFKPCQFAAGTRIFAAGDRADALYVIRSGRVRVELTTYEGECLVLTELETGDVLGEVSFLDGGSRTASAVAVEDTEMLAFDRGELLNFVTEHPHAALDLMGVMAHRLRVTDELLRMRVSRNPNVEEEEMITFGERIADKVAAFGGSWTFISIFGGVLVTWVIINTVLLMSHPFDPYPFILLNLFLSMLAAIQAPVIMMSQNRQSSKDRLKADLDYRVNMKAELEVSQLHRKVDQIYEILQERFPKLECQFRA
jgi:CRP/FNR family cyclic AMP-dependent transcriptional regulator